MAETVGDLLVKISADTGDLKAKLAEVGLSLDQLVSKSNRAGDGFTKLQASTVALEAGLSLAERALRPLIDGLEQIADAVEASVAAAGKEEAAQSRLAATLRAGGQFSEAYAEKLHAAAESLGALTGFSSEAITESQALFVAFGATADQIPQLTQAAITLAKTFGGDLTERARQLITDINGDSDALGRLGIKHDETAGKAKRFADVLAFTAKVADPSTITGYEQSISQLGNAFENVQKALGAVIISTPEFQAILATIKESLDQTSSALGDNKAALIDFVGGSITLAVNGLGILETAIFDVVKAFELLNAVLPQNLAETVQRLAAGISLTPVADSIGAVIDKTIDFQARFESATEAIKAKAAEAAGQSGVGAIAAGAEKTAASADTIAPAFEQAAQGVAASSAAVVSGMAQLRTAADSTATSIVKIAEGVFTSGPAAIASVEKLNASFDRTPAQAKKAEDAIRSLSEATAGIKLDTKVAGFSELDAELAKTEANIRKVGTEAGLTGAEITRLLGTALDAVKEKFEAIGTKAFADISHDVQASAEAVAEFGESFDQTPAIIDRVRAKIVELRAEGLGATEGARALAAELRTLEGKVTISIRAETREAEAAVAKLESDIQRGADPVTIAIDKTEADQKIADLDKSIKSLGQTNPIRLDAEKSQAEVKIKETQALAQEKQTMPVDADTSAAKQQIDDLTREIDRRFTAAMDAVAGKSKSLGSFDPSQLNSALSSVPGLIKSADIDKLTEALAGFREFIHFNTGPSAAFGAGAANVGLAQNAADAIARAIQTLGGNSLNLGGNFKTDQFSAALADLSKQVSAGSNDSLKASQRTDQSINRVAVAAERTAVASEGLARHFSSAIFGTVIANSVQSALRQTTGDRSAGLIA